MNADVAAQLWEMVKNHAWVPLAALVIHVVVRMSKSNSWPPWFTITARTRSWLALGLGIVSGILDAVVGGSAWGPALVGGLISAITAISGHDLIVESLRNGRDIGVPKKEFVVQDVVDLSSEAKSLEPPPR